MQAAIAERVEQHLAALAAEDSNASAADAAGASASSNGSNVHQELTELILDGRTIRSVTPEDATELQRFTSLAKLTLNQTGLASLANLPCMPTVRTLEATDNHISKDLDLLVKAFPNLKKLQLGGNHIKTFEDLKPLAALAHLEHVGLDLNPVATLPDYRSQLFALVPSLQVVDSQDRTGKDCDGPESDDEEEEDADEADTTLKDFYEGEMPEQDAEDAEDFEPPSGQEDADEEIEEDDDALGEEEDDDDDEEEVEAGDDDKRKADGGAAESASKLPRIN